MKEVYNFKPLGNLILIFSSFPSLECELSSSIILLLLSGQARFLTLIPANV